MTLLNGTGPDLMLALNDRLGLSSAETQRKIVYSTVPENRLCVSALKCRMFVIEVGVESSLRCGRYRCPESASHIPLPLR